MTGFAGGGIGGLFGLKGGDIKIDTSIDHFHFKDSVDVLNLDEKIKQQLNPREGRVNELNKTSLGSWRDKSEGVGEDLLFISGWDGAGPHQIVKSDSHSQSWRELFGGRKVSESLRWFGPRKLSLEVEKLNQTQDVIKQETYWDILQKSGEYIGKKDLEGIDKYWKERNPDLEEDILCLYRGREWWIDKFGVVKDTGLVELEFQLTNLKKLLESNEEALITKGWQFGQIVNNKKIKQSRLLGDVEQVFFNYLRKIFWGNRSESKSLREKNIGLVIKALLNGEQAGFDCSENNEVSLKEFFSECQKFKGNANLKSVLKSTHYRNGYFRIPEKEIKTFWTWNDMRKVTDKAKAIKRDDLKKSPLIDEECEESNLFSFLGDSSLELRRNICSQIVIPWFGDVVGDKRLCLIEIPEFQYYLRLNTYLNVLDLPTWHSNNTFWTKCSNYGA
ncbi:hypothetical protein [Mycoplasma ovis]|nr:hypothetical protein [Mycoplasma ovis]